MRRLLSLLAGTAAAGSMLVLPSTGPARAADNPAPACEVGATRYISDQSAAANLSRIGFPESWKIATGKGVTVAVIDSGVSDANVHLKGVVEPGQSFVGGDSGRVDPYGHGTAIAGIIAAQKVNGSVLVGAAYGAKILPVRVFVQQPETEVVAKGIRWAADNGADVINVSISTGTNDTALPQLRDAAEYAQSKGALIVASGGNQVEDVPLVQDRFPAGLDAVIGVAAASASGAVDNWSIHGEHNDVSAPGSNVLIAYHSNGDCLAATDHAYTSWATAYVSALAAQLMEKFPDESAKQIGNRIRSTADRPRLDERDETQGWGLIQPYAALTTSSNAAPGTSAADKKSENRAASPAGITPVNASSDPMQPTRTAMLWWAIGGVGLAGAALVLRPWLRTVPSRRRSRR